MKTLVVPFGTQIALPVRDPSVNSTPEVTNLKTVGDLLNRLAKNPPLAYRMIRTTCSLLVTYLGLPIDEMLIDSVNESKDGFRPFLEGRTYAENSVRTYVNHVRILLRWAGTFGWKSDDGVPEEWRGVLALAKEKKCMDIVLCLAKLKKTPNDVTTEDVDRWVQMKVAQGFSYYPTIRKKTLFWRLLVDCGCTEQVPMCIVREKDYGIPLEDFPVELKRQVRELLRWKRAEYSRGRPKSGHHREITSKRLEHVICALYGFTVNIRGESGVNSLAELIQEQTIGELVEWSINERKVKGQSLQVNLGTLCAAMHQHPAYKSMDLTWFRPLLDGIPMERESELKRRKAEKYLEYDVVASIPGKIRAERPAAAKKGKSRAALLVMQELLMKWFTVLPWRQRNVRQCRIDGPTPNLFKGKIPPFSDIEKPEWVIQEEQSNPEAEFWQFHFSPDETKTGIEVEALLPRQLIGLLEEYLKDFRPCLLNGPDPETLFLNQAGNPMAQNQVTETVCALTLRHGGRRVSPHPFRDIVAYTWLKAHPKDFLTLSKMLWHSDVNTTIRSHGSRFNESTGVCAMEGWLDDREAKSK